MECPICRIASLVKDECEGEIYNPENEDEYVTSSIYICPRCFTRLEVKATLNIDEVERMNEEMKRNEFVSTLLDFLVEKGDHGEIAAVEVAEKMDSVYPGFLRYYNERT